MRRNNGVVWAFVLAVGLTATTAQVEAGDYLDVGQGNDSCGTWIANRRNDEAATETAWLAGFITGYNVQRELGGRSGMLGQGTDVEAVSRWIDNYCQHYPLDVLSEAATHLMAELKTRTN